MVRFLEFFELEVTFTVSHTIREVGDGKGGCRSFLDINYCKRLLLCE